MATVTLTEYCSTEDINVQLTKVNTILANLMNAMIDGTIDFGREGYSFDDGQTKIQTNFRSLDQISKAYEHWFKVKNLLLMQCEGGGIFTARNMNFRCGY